MTKKIFSGVQPTGNLHLGNYLGAIKNFVSLQNDYECFFCVVDLHAITVWQDPEKLKQQTREVAAAFIASGINPEQSIIFNRTLFRYKYFITRIRNGFEPRFVIKKNITMMSYVTTRKSANFSTSRKWIINSR